MAQTKEIKAVHSLHRLTTAALSLDSRVYKRRNFIERVFCKLKNLATHRNPI